MCRCRGSTGLRRRSASAPPKSTPGVPRTRILAVTANAQAEDREACLAAGMDGFLVKPLDPMRLREAVDGLSPRGTATLAAEFHGLICRLSGFPHIVIIPCSAHAVGG